MNNNIKLPPMPLAASSYGMAGEYTQNQMRAYAREAVLLNATVPEDLKEKLTDLIAYNLRGTWHCNRVWEAWYVGTMSKNDFEPVEESDTPAELADAVIAMLSAAPTRPHVTEVPEELT